MVVQLSFMPLTPHWIAEIEYQQRPIVRRRTRTRKRGNLIHDLIADIADERAQAIPISETRSSPNFLLRVGGLTDAVGVYDQHVTPLDLH